MGQMLVEREAALREVLDWEAGLQALHARIALRFSRSEFVSGFWRTARIAGVGGAQEWMAVGRIRWGRHARWGAAVAGGVPTWDADQVRDDLQGYVMEHLGDPGGVR